MQFRLSRQILPKLALELQPHFNCFGTWLRTQWCKVAVLKITMSLLVATVGHCYLGGTVALATVGHRYLGGTVALAIHVARFRQTSPLVSTRKQIPVRVAYLDLNESP